MSTTSSASLPLQGKTAVVTGASRGIEAGLARELACRGANVTISSPAEGLQIYPHLLQVALVYPSPNSEDRTKSVASGIISLGKGSKSHIIQADLKRVEAPEKIVTSIREAFGDSVDILVNNAGVIWANSIEETTVEDFAGISDVNVRAQFLLIRAVLPMSGSPAGSSTCHQSERVQARPSCHFTLPPKQHSRA